MCQPRLEDFVGMDLRSYQKVQADGFWYCGAFVRGVVGNA